SEPLAPLTWFRLGGPAEFLARPRTVEQLVALLARCREADFPYHILSGGSNVLVRDEGVKGLVVPLGSPAFAHVTTSGRPVEPAARSPWRRGSPRPPAPAWPAWRSSPASPAPSAAPCAGTPAAGRGRSASSSGTPPSSTPHTRSRPASTTTSSSAIAAPTSTTR